MKAFLAAFLVPAALLAAPGDFLLTKLKNPGPGQDPFYFPPTPNTVWTFNNVGVLTAKPISEIGGATTWGAITGTLSSQTDLVAALNLKSDLASPIFTGSPQAPTAAPGTNTTQLATTAFVQAAMGSMGDVVGPAGATNESVALFDGTTGKLLKSSGAFVFDTANVRSSISGANPAVTLTNTGDSSTSYLGTFGTIGQVQISYNRNPATGAISNGSRTSSYVSLVGNSGSGFIAFNSSNTNNTAPSEIARITGGGRLLIGSTSDSGDTLQVAGNLTVNAINSNSGNWTIAASNSLVWNGRARIVSPTASNIRLTNNAANNFGLLQFGGDTNLFPALKRSNAQLQVRLADDSGFGPLAASDLTLNKTITPAGTTGNATINNPTGSVNFPVSGASLVVTNSMVTVNSVIQCTVATNQDEVTQIIAVPAAGSFTMYPKPNLPDVEVKVFFSISN